MSIETLLEAAKFLELQAQQQKARGKLLFNLWFLGFRIYFFPLSLIDARPLYICTYNPEVTALLSLTANRPKRAALLFPPLPTE